MIRANRGSAGFVFALFLLLGMVWGTTGAADSGPAPEGAVHLVHDFFPGEFQTDLAPPQLTKLGNTLFFVGADRESGHGVWRTDGTAAGTHRVPIAGSSGSGGLAGVADEAIILGAAGGFVFWFTGVPEISDATVLVSARENGDAVVLHNISNRIAWKLGGKLFFEDCPSTECVTWVSDGTATGTVPVSALNAPVIDAANKEILGTFADRWLVLRSGQALLAYDVTKDRVLTLLARGARGLEVVPVGNSLFFITRYHRERLWISRLEAPRASNFFSSERLYVAGGRDGRLYFTTENGRLWSTDGHRENTRSYTGLQTGSFSQFIKQLGAVHSTTLIPVFSYDWQGLLGADETTHKLRPLYVACRGKYPCLGLQMSDVTLAGDQAFQSINGSLLRSDGTRQGTSLHPFLYEAAAYTFSVLDGRLLLGAADRQHGHQLWETDGTAEGTKALSDGTPDQPFRVQGPPVSFDGALFVAADRKPVGQQLWRVAGGRTTPVTDLRHLASGIDPTIAFLVGDRTVLNNNFTQNWAGVSEHGRAEDLPSSGNHCSSPFDEPCSNPALVVGQRLLFTTYPSDLWSTDGTAAGTVPVKNPEDDLAVAALGRLGNGAVVLTLNGSLWSVDGTPSGTRLIAQLPFDPDLAPDGHFRPVGPPVALGSLTFLFRRAPVSGNPNLEELEIWRTDGTAAGTLRLASTPFSDIFAPILSPVVVGGRLFFRFGGAIWTSDGSVQGTYALPNQLPGGTFALAAGTGTLYAAAGYQDDDPDHQALWAIDPLTLGASLLGTFPRVDSGIVGATAGSVLADTLFFRVTDPRGVETVWLTEGTAASTRPLPGPLSSLEKGDFFTSGGRRYFAACEAEHGCELWSTDRLGEDTRLVVDLWPGPRSGQPQILAVSEKTLLFAGTEPTAGRELWKLDLRSSLRAATSARSIRP
jgi:ELWxxDGT repeat protein